MNSQHMTALPLALTSSNVLDATSAEFIHERQYTHAGHDIYYVDEEQTKHGRGTKIKW